MTMIEKVARAICFEGRAMSADEQLRTWSEMPEQSTDTATQFGVALDGALRQTVGNLTEAVKIVAMRFPLSTNQRRLIVLFLRKNAVDDMRRRYPEMTEEQVAALAENPR